MTGNDIGGSGPLCHDDAAYVLGALSPADRRAYEEHLRDCVSCQASVRSLAGMPGLLALTTEDVVTGERPELPPTLLPRLLRRAQVTHRRRRLLIGSLAAAAAVLLVAVVSVIARPEPSTTTAGPGGSSTSSSASPLSSSASSTPAPDQTVPLAQVMPGPMTATLELADKRWGTAITVICSYDEALPDAVAYDLAIVDVDGHETSAGSWTGVPGVTARVPVATAVPRERISEFEVQLADGRTILRGSP